MALEKGSRPKPQRKPVPKSPTPARTAARPARETADTSGEQPRRAEAPRSAAPQSLFAARRDEFIGIAYVAAGVLVGLGIYFNLAGPFGRGVEQVVGWLTGLGRYLVPVILVTFGVVLVRQGHTTHRVRFAVGFALTGLSLLGMLHVVRGPAKIMSGFSTLGKAGGWFGALVGEPSQRLLGKPATMVLLIGRAHVCTPVT